MSAQQQELITFIPGTMPRTPDDPMIWIDVATRSLRIVHKGSIIPLEPMSEPHRLIFKDAIDRMIHHAQAGTRPPAKFRERG